MLLDLVGQRFDQLTVIKRLESVNRNSRWLCRCDCGNLHEAYAINLKNGNVVSCGCVKRVGKNPADTVEGTRLSALTRKKSELSGTKIKGVCWDKTRKRWKAYIGLKGKILSLGSYKNFDDAVKARKEAEKTYFDPILDKYKKYKKED